MGEYLEAILLGIVQGLTEFLPVSSSAHLIIVSWFLDGKPIPIVVNIALHLGTTCAVLLYFWRDWLSLAQSSVNAIVKREMNWDMKVLWPSLIIGSIPAAIIGLKWQDQIEETLHHPLATAIPLAFVGILLWLVDSKAEQKNTLEKLRWRDAFLIGVAQACALIPGVSRSGATMTCARALKYVKADAAKFSFLLGTPAMLGAAAKNYQELFENITHPLFYVGFLVSMITGCVAIKFLMEFIKRFSFLSFAIYRVLLAAAILVIFLQG